MIKVTKGATLTILGTAYDENAVPVNLTTYSAEFAIKLRVSDPDPPLVLLTNGAGVTYLDQTTNPGQYRVVVEKEVTDTLSGGEYWCDLHISLASARYTVIENTRMVVTVPVNRLGGGSPATPGQPSGYGHFVKKASAGTIAIGVPVYAVGYSAGFLLVEAAQHNVTPDACAIMSTSTTDTTAGYATVIGTIAGVNTAGMAVGDRVFLGSSAFVTTRSPGRQELARVMVVSASAGVLNVNVGESDVVKRLTPTTWANVELLAADPLLPVARDLWGRTDNRLAMRGDDAVTRYAWFTEAAPLALHDIGLVRYWFVDYDAGSDDPSRPGYIDAALGATFTALQTGPVALKTLERLAQLYPRVANGRGSVVLIKNRVLGSRYRNMANTADDVLDLRGHTGYEFEIFRGSSDLTNSALDRVYCGGVQNPVGPDVGGAYTVSSVADAHTFGISTTPWATNTLNGRRIRFASDASAPYADQCMSIQTNSTGGIVLMERISATLPLVGDKFFIETPGVQIDKILMGDMPNAYRQTAANTANSRRAVVGFSFSSSTQISFAPDTGQFAFIEQAAVTTNFVTFASSGPLSGVLNFNRSYGDEAGTTRRPGSSIFNAPGTITTYNALITGNAFNHTTAFQFTFSRGQIAGGAYFATAPTLAYCGWSAGSAGFPGSGVFPSTRFGQISQGAQRRVVVNAGVLALEYCHIQTYGVQFNSTASTPYIRARGQGCNLTFDDCLGTGGTDVCVETTTCFDSSIAFDRVVANGMTASLGSIRQNGNAIIPTFVSLAGRTVIDQAKNRHCGTGVMAVQNEQQLAADPAAPAIADNWWRADNRMALRGADAITRYAWFTKGQVLADHAATIRYYAVDYINGVDTRLGYSDVDAATAGTVSIKTLTKLREIVPVFGQGQVIVILVAGDPAGADLQYLKPDGLTLDDLDLRLFGYRKVFVRSTRNFVNDTADKTILGAAIGVTGPGAGGVWTCAAGSTTSNIVSASATLPAETSATQMRVRFTGNVTAALANQCRNVYFNDSGNIIPGLNLTNAPAAGDTFYIERPGVSVNNININIYAGSGLNFNQTDNAVVICGFRARQTDVNPSVHNYNSNDIRISFMEADQFLSVRNTGFFQVDSQYQDEAGGTITTGSGIRHAQNRGTIFQGLTKVTYNESGIYSSNTNLTILNCASYVIGKACYFPRRLTLNFCGTGAANAPGIFLFGSGGVGQPSRHVNSAAGIPLALTSTNGRIDGVDVSNAGANPCISGQSVGQGLLSFRNITSRAGGNTGVVLSFGEAGFALPVSSRIDIATSVGSIASGGDLKIGDASIVTFASVQLSRVIDIWGNDFGGVLGTDQPITRKTPGIAFNEPILGADPASPVNGDRWVTDIAGVRNICVRIGGVTYRSLLT